MICANCKHMKEYPVGKVSYRFYCSISKGATRHDKMGVIPNSNRPHKKCPLRVTE